MKTFLLFLASSAMSIAALPSVGPDYRRPATDAPPAYRGLNPDQTAGQPLPASGWWTLFRAPALDRLETQAVGANQDLRAAGARVEQALAATGVARSAAWPQAALSASATRTQFSTTAANPFPAALSNDFTVPLTVSWEIDLFGRVRRLKEGAQADAVAAADLFDSIRLSVAAAVATDYFSLRGLDRESLILEQTIGLRRRELDLVSAQVRNGVASDLDAARAETELAGAQADADAVAARRESVQDALAVLVGEDASRFSLTASTDSIELPSIPAGLPSELLTRRPDIAGAERTLDAANARIGVAKAAFFPSISLTGAAGFDSGETGRLFSADSRIWSIGPSVYLPIFQGGRNRANLDRARAAYQENLANYRSQILTAFREVQESLAVNQQLTDQAQAEDRAVASAKRAANLAQIRYRAGYVSYLDVVDAQRTELENERAFAELFAVRLNNEVALIKALGGGWSVNPGA
ncbi:MAG TPA: efflux transporter outer membrane subunit [Opitutaceae bacterium]|jgi:multidrug efflux system outer membrane protein